MIPWGSVKAEIEKATFGDVSAGDKTEFVLRHPSPSSYVFLQEEIKSEEALDRLRCNFLLVFSL